jgi:hypothetical protein
VLTLTYVSCLAAEASIVMYTYPVIIEPKPLDQLFPSGELDWMTWASLLFAVAGLAKWDNLGREALIHLLFHTRGQGWAPLVSLLQLRALAVKNLKDLPCFTTFLSPKLAGTMVF